MEALLLSIGRHPGAYYKAGILQAWRLHYKAWRSQGRQSEEEKPCLQKKPSPLQTNCMKLLHKLVTWPSPGSTFELGKLTAYPYGRPSVPGGTPNLLLQTEAHAVTCTGCRHGSAWRGTAVRRLAVAPSSSEGRVPCCLCCPCGGRGWCMLTGTNIHHPEPSSCPQNIVA